VGGGQTRRADRGMGGQYFERRRKKLDCHLTVKYVLCGLNPGLLHSLLRQSAAKYMAATFSNTKSKQKTFFIHIYILFL
jgi:hypothetical protein